MEIGFKCNQVIETRTLWISMVPNPITNILLKEKFGRRQTQRKEFHVTTEAEGELLQLPAREGAVSNAGSHHGQGA